MVVRRRKGEEEEDKAKAMSRAREKLQKKRKQPQTPHATARSSLGCLRLDRAEQRARTAYVKFLKVPSPLKLQFPRGKIRDKNNFMSCHVV